MRTIKFRAWNTAAKMWQTGYSGITCDGYKLVKSANQDYVMSRDVALEFQQFTGLEDKNSKEVYEGDFVRGPLANGFGSYQTMTGIVFYNNDKARFAIEISDKDYEKFEWSIGESVEVIGNIYENPQLLTNTE